MSENMKQVGRESGETAKEAAAAVSNSMEHIVGSEPMNSTIRTALLIATGASIVTSLVLQITDKKNEALFVGQWAPTILLIALWGQVVKE
jgi:hypothetical protein